MGTCHCSTGRGWRTARDAALGPTQAIGAGRGGAGCSIPLPLKQIRTTPRGGYLLPSVGAVAVQVRKFVGRRHAALQAAFLQADRGQPHIQVGRGNLFLQSCQDGVAKRVPPGRIYRLGHDEAGGWRRRLRPAGEPGGRGKTGEVPRNFGPSVHPANEGCCHQGDQAELHGGPHLWQKLADRAVINDRPVRSVFDKNRALGGRSTRQSWGARGFGVRY